ncbi:MAG: tyrosine-type recombinase/integrase, partial [Cellulosimicrobium cellulans]
TVLTVPEFDWVVDQLKTWTSGGMRAMFATADRSSAMWPSERGARMSLGSFGDAFAAARDAVGLPKELGLHCLRHSYVTHLIEAGYDPAFVQIIWSRNRGVFDVQHGARNRAIPRDGGAYLKLSITRDRGRVNAGSTSFGVRFAA